MENDLCGVSSSSSLRNHRSATTIKYQSGAYIDLGEFEGDEDISVEYPCPFCSDEYDLVELCHHIDEEHHLEANHGICPICSKRVKIYMVDHIVMQHRDVLKNDQKQTSYRDDLSYSSNKHLHISKTEIDPFLSFLHNSPLPNQTNLTQLDLNLEDENSIKESTERDKKVLCPLSDTEQLEKTRRCEFVQEILSSAMLKDWI